MFTRCSNALNFNSFFFFVLRISCILTINRTVKIYINVTWTELSYHQDLDLRSAHRLVFLTERIVSGTCYSSIIKWTGRDKRAQLLPLHSITGQWLRSLLYNGPTWDPPFLLFHLGTETVSVYERLCYFRDSRRWTAQKPNKCNYPSPGPVKFGTELALVSWWRSSLSYITQMVVT